MLVLMLAVWSGLHGNRCRKRSRWRGGRKSRWSSLSWWSTVDLSPSTKRVRTDTLLYLSSFYLYLQYTFLNGPFVCVRVCLRVCVCVRDPVLSPFQRSGLSGHVSGICHHSQRPRQRSLPRGQEGSASCSITVASSPG